MPKQIAIIGAGMGGLVCADHLVQAGFECQVFDKGRRLGGRLATRVQDGLAFNHGAPGLAAAGTEFKGLMKQLVAAGAAQTISWPENVRTTEFTEFVGWPHMNDLLGPLTVNFQVRQSVEISALEKRSHGWELVSLDGRSFGPFDAVLVCIPARQAHNLVKACKPACKPDWDANLDTVRYDPCMTMLCAIEDKHPGLASAVFEGQSALDKQFQQSGGQELPVDIARWVVHATPEWSSNNLEREPADIARDLLQEFVSVNALSNVRTIFLHAHRWRYARVREPFGMPCLWDTEMGIGLAGDWCLGPNAEHAYDSGRSLARQVIHDMLQN